MLADLRSLAPASTPTPTPAPRLSTACSTPSAARPSPLLLGGEEFRQPDLHKGERDGRRVGVRRVPLQELDLPEVTRGDPR